MCLLPFFLGLDKQGFLIWTYKLLQVIHILGIDEDVTPPAGWIEHLEHYLECLTGAVDLVDQRSQYLPIFCTQYSVLVAVLLLFPILRQSPQQPPHLGGLPLPTLGGGDTPMVQRPGDAPEGGDPFGLDTGDDGLVLHSTSPTIIRSRSGLSST